MGCCNRLGLKDKHLFFKIQEAEKSKTKVWADWVLAKGSCSGSAVFLSLCPHVVGRDHLSHVSSCKGPNLILESSTLMSQLPYKDPISKYHHIVD